eukprot:9915143-Ditylum_brightwellii.AAC.1
MMKFLKESLLLACLQRFCPRREVTGCPYHLPCPVEAKLILEGQILCPEEATRASSGHLRPV